MKLAGSVLVMIASSGIGFLYASEIKKRKYVLEELHNLLKLLLGDIRYMRASLCEAIGNAKRRHHGSFAGFLEEISELMSDSPGVALQDIWKQAVVKGLGNVSLNQEDKQRMIVFGGGISSPERDTVIACFEQYIEETEVKIKEVHNMAASKVKLYRSMGVLTGIFIVILFV